MGGPFGVIQHTTGTGCGSGIFAEFIHPSTNFSPFVRFSGDFQAT
jgi:hypothetical protein